MPQRALLDKYCATCHNDKLKTGGLSLQAADVTNPPAAAETWEKVIRKLRVGAMPPQGARRPDEAGLDPAAYAAAYPGCDPTHADINHDGQTNGRDIQGFSNLVTGSSANLPPTAVAGANPTQGVAPLTVNFSSAGSFDPEGGPLTYLWTFGDSATSSEANPSHTYTVDGQYQARLTVSDGANFATSPPISIIATIDPNTIRMGETSVFGGNDNGNGNLLLVQDATLSQAATIQSLSFYVNAAGGNLRLGIYDATGPGGGPGALKAQTNAFSPVVGWNTAAVISPVALPPANYWLAYLPSSSSLNFATNFSIGSVSR
jgi:hypothetical protein